jgi:hypothetical protein
MLNHKIQQIIKKFTAYLEVLLLTLILSFSALSTISTLSASALTVNGGQDCSANSVISCGATTTAQLISEYNNTTAYPGVHAIYNYFGITSNDVAALNSTAVAGSVNKNGDVVVGGKVVATNAMTAGRENIAGSTKVTYQGETFYKRTPSVSFTVDSIAAFVVMKNGVFQFAILAPCGNPVTATPPPTPTPTPKPVPQPKPVPTPTFACTDLTLSLVPANSSNVVMNVTHTQSNGAIYKNVTYTIKDDTTGALVDVTGTDTNQNYSFTTYGKQTIIATPNFLVNGVIYSASNDNCVKSITLAKPVTPVYVCTGLTLSVASSNVNQVEANVTHAQANGATYKDVTYTVKDDTTNAQTNVNGSDTNQSFTFSTYGEQTIIASVNFVVNGTVVSSTNSNCVRSITIAQPSTPTYACTGLNLSDDPSNADSIVATSTFSESGGATFQSAIYDFGDNTTNTIVTPANLTVNHTFMAAGTYIVSVTYTFLVNGASKSVSDPNCIKSVTFTPPATVMCTIPGLAQYPANSPNCVTVVPPSNLVNTGPGGVGTFVIILGIASVLGGTGYYTVAKHRTKDLIEGHINNDQ